MILHYERAYLHDKSQEMLCFPPVPRPVQERKKEMHAQIIIETTVQERKEKTNAQIVTETKPEKEEGDHG